MNPPGGKNDIMNQAPASSPAPDPVDRPLPEGRRARKARAVRQALFNAGLAAFERQPIGLVSVLDITEAADVAKGVFYLHFQSKDQYLLALWEEVRQRFLAIVTARVEGGRSRAARIDGLVNAYHDLASEQPEATRFWIRMAAYFPDEIGPTGHLGHLRRTYLTRLAHLVNGETGSSADDIDLGPVQLIDAICWSFVVTRIQTDSSLTDPAVMMKIVHAAVRAFASTRS